MGYFENTGNYIAPSGWEEAYPKLYTRPENTPPALPEMMMPDGRMVPMDYVPPAPVPPRQMPFAPMMNGMPTKIWHAPPQQVQQDQFGGSWTMPMPQQAPQQPQGMPPPQPMDYGVRGAFGNIMDVYQQRLADEQKYRKRQNARAGVSQFMADVGVPLVGAMRPGAAKHLAPYRESLIGEVDANRKARMSQSADAMGQLKTMADIVERMDPESLKAQRETLKAQAAYYNSMASGRRADAYGQNVINQGQYNQGRLGQGQQRIDLDKQKFQFQQTLGTQKLEESRARIEQMKKRGVLDENKYREVMRYHDQLAQHWDDQGSALNAYRDETMEARRLNDILDFTAALQAQEAMNERAAAGGVVQKGQFIPNKAEDFRAQYGYGTPAPQPTAPTPQGPSAWMQALFGQPAQGAPVQPTAPQATPIVMPQQGKLSSGKPAPPPAQVAAWLAKRQGKR